MGGAAIGIGDNYGVEARLQITVKAGRCRYTIDGYLQWRLPSLGQYEEYASLLIGGVLRKKG